MDARRRGVSGLKVFKNLGLTTRDATGALVSVDDPRLDPIWAACGRLGMPVLIHTADPEAFFTPPDETNERWMQLQRHLDFRKHQCADRRPRNCPGLSNGGSFVSFGWRGNSQV